MERGKGHEYEILVEIGVVSVNSQFLIYVQVVKYRNKYKDMWTCMYVCVCVCVQNFPALLITELSSNEHTQR